MEAASQIRLVLLGAPGAGKGTVAKGLVGPMGVSHLSTGDMLRTAIADGTSLGLLAKPYMDAGKYVPDETIVDLLVERATMSDCERGFLLDGFPRTVKQAIALEKRSLGPQCVIRIDVSDDVVVERLARRRVCVGCGRPYSIATVPARGACETCGGMLVQRDDDRPETIANRLETYRSQTDVPLTSFYGERVLETNGDRDPSDVLDFVLRSLSSRGLTMNEPRRR